LYEELFEDSVQVESTTHPKIHRAVGMPVPVDELGEWVESLPMMLPKSDEEELLQDLKRLVPSFQSVSAQQVSR
jgi:outer membrane biogenesis lipoprotein LolB